MDYHVIGAEKLISTKKLADNDNVMKTFYIAAKDENGQDVVLKMEISGTDVNVEQLSEEQARTVGNWRCSNCGRLNSSSARTCTKCGFERPQMRALKTLKEMEQ
jgi:ribosomal protein L40E